MDPEMEALLFEWCVQEVRKQKKSISRSCIKQKAKHLSQNKSNFKASKGWLDKFMKRFSYLERMREILNEGKLLKKETSFNSFNSNNNDENSNKITEKLIKKENLISNENHSKLAFLKTDNHSRELVY